MNNKSAKVAVAMSGGVDSSVAAALLKEQGYFVIGIFMKFWKDPSTGLGQVVENRCCSIESEKLARAVAKKIGIPFYAVNVEKEFKKKVVDYFLAEYKKGNTPNPCVVCNKEIKFGFLIKKALSLGADFVATGHYAKLAVGSKVVSRKSKLQRPKGYPNYKLLTARDTSKDQSYFLWQLSQKQLSHVLFPVGGYTKPEVRKLAKKFKLPTAETPESQEVCFVQDTTNNFLGKYLKVKPGLIVEKNGKVIGRHNGLWFYTIGQRKGIGLSGGPYYVVDKDFKKNVLIVSKNEKDLLQKELVASDVNWISGKNPKLSIKVQVKIRYKSKSVSATIYKLRATHYSLKFDAPQRAITSGQSAVFYRGKQLLGGGVIV